MGKLLSKIFGNKEMRILMLGLDAAGKTSILYLSPLLRDYRFASGEPCRLSFAFLRAGLCRESGRYDPEQLTVACVPETVLLMVQPVNGERLHSASEGCRPVRCDL